MNQLPSAGRILIITGQNGTGKTRWMESLSKNVLDEFLSDPLAGPKLVCLSGTVMDRFPLELSEQYGYFGRRTNNNMFSEIAPYRRLLKFMADSLSDNSGETRAKAAQELLTAIDLDPTLRISFRRGRNSRDKGNQTLSGKLKISVSLDAIADSRLLLEERSKQVDQGIIHISSVGFSKLGTTYELMDLSSGERTYALTILALAFGSTDNSIILYDEPENSLHPQWQSRITKDMWKLISAVSQGSKLIVATHSPLVVSGALNSETYVMDMDKNSQWIHSSLYGNSVDSILKQQFGLLSPRANSFLSKLRDCLEKLVKVESDPTPFLHASEQLLDMGVQLDADDPLFQTLEDIKLERERLQ